MRRPGPGADNCLLLAVAEALSARGTPTDNFALRRGVAAYTRDHIGDVIQPWDWRTLEGPETQMGRRDCDDINEYLRHIARPDAWGGNMKLLAPGRIFPHAPP